MVCRRHNRGSIDSVGGTHAHRRRRSAVRADPSPTLSVGWSGGVVLSWQAVLAGGPVVHLSAMDCEPSSVVAVSVQHRGSRVGRGCVVRATPVAWTTGGVAVLHWFAFSRPRFL